MIGPVRVRTVSPAQMREREIARLLRGAKSGRSYVRKSERPYLVPLMRHTVIACAGCAREIKPYESAIAQYSEAYLLTFYWHTPKCRTLEEPHG